jgi:VWFA-related protein
MSSSTEAGRIVTPTRPAKGFLAYRVFPCFLLCAGWILVCPTSALGQGGTPAPAPSPDAQSEAKQNSAELASHDEPTTFKVNVKLVVVRAVVRDAQGHAVGNLHREDFQVFDRGKPQTLSQFEVEQPGTLTAKARQRSNETASDIASGDTPHTPENAPAAPERFVAYMFDDVHLEFADLARTRQAAERHFSSLRPTDRAAIFTTSGTTVLDFTDDHAKLHEALVHLQPHPIVGSSQLECPEISYYQADLIINKNDPQALQVGAQEAQQCNSNLPLSAAQQLATTVSGAVLSAGDHESRLSLGSIKDVVHRISRMPGPRSVILVSPGFITPQLENEYSEIIDLALRSQVVISALDARGLYVLVPFGDASHVPNSVLAGGFPPPPGKDLLLTAAASAQDDLLAILTEGTGGVFFHSNNDFDEGFRRVAETPDYSYVLAFVPQNLKLDGSFHNLKITLKTPQKLTLQARRGYYAPKNFASPDEQARQEIEDAMYSQEELHNLPVKLHTQFFKASDEDARLVVLAHVDVRLLHFRKLEGRNNNVLTCVSALFNRNGNFIQGIQKTVTMHWKDETLERKLGSGITLKTSFDVKPGSYLVRLVVRDAEGQMMSAENGTVEIR